MSGQGYDGCAMPIIMQDNTLTVTLVTKGGGKYRTKYLKVRVNLVKEKQDSGELEIRYMPTKLMLADVLTKPLQGTLFQTLVGKVIGSP